MPRSPEGAALEAVEAALRAVLGRPVERVAVPRGPAAGDLQVDLLLRAGRPTLGVEWKAAGDAAHVGRAIQQLLALKKRGGARLRSLVPIVAVPFMGETGRRLCDEAGVSWIDLSGNASIDAPGYRIRIAGNANRFADRGRPANVFAVRSSRVARALLMEPGRAFTQAELVAESGVDKGRVSRLIPRLVSMGLAERLGPGQRVRVANPALALDAWHEAYDFWRHEVLQGHVAARTPDELIARIARASKAAPRPWALTGLAAAWRLTRTAMFRLTTVVVGERPSEAWLSAIGFREEPRGANVWIVRPADASVFQGMRLIEGVPCVHPLQAYLDLKAHPERATEAAAELRRQHLQWGAR